MSVEDDDLRAAVASGVISEAQAAALTNLADVRRGVREATAQIEEPFELFRGFNEIFIVVGLIILYGGWLAFSGLQIFDIFSDDPVSTNLIVYGLISLVVTIGLTGYFTLKRRMIAPSILLSMIFLASSYQTAGGFVVGFTPGEYSTPLIMTGFAFFTLLAYWYWCRIPFVMLLMALNVFAFFTFLFIVDDNSAPDLADLFLLSNEGPFAVITFVLGLVGFAIAMRFDMSDPHRVTRRSVNGFWLHVIAAPAIVNTIALTLFESGRAVDQAVLLAFLILMAVVALIIDRRSFLISGVGYVVALSVTVMEGGAALAVLLLGLILILLGANWERFRSTILNILPPFPGKSKLPPWNQISGDTA